MDGKYKLTYFALWAKGPAPALALAFSGLDWTGDDAINWNGQTKAKAAWNILPNLDIPGDELKIGHEGAVLNYIGKKVPSMAGETDRDFAASQQLFFVGEDIYNKLVSHIDTTFEKKGKDKARESFWGMDNDTTHNYRYGLKVYLKQLEDFYKQSGNSVEVGKFTTTGTTVGECKLFSSLHACVMIKGVDIFKESPSVASFYTRFLNEKNTQAVIAGGGNYPNVFHQYFVDTAST